MDAETQDVTSLVSESDITPLCRSGRTGSTPVRGAEWAAGIIEGEGTIVLKNQRIPQIQVQMTDRDVLDELQRILGGKIYDMKKRQAHWKDCWIWTTVTVEEGIAGIEAILPYLCSRRTEKAVDVLDKGRAVDKNRQQLRSSRQERNERIREYVSQGMSRAEAGRKEGVSRQRASRIANGKE